MANTVSSANSLVKVPAYDRHRSPFFFEQPFDAQALFFWNEWNRTEPARGGRYLRQFNISVGGIDGHVFAVSFCLSNHSERGSYKFRLIDDDPLSGILCSATFDNVAVIAIAWVSESFVEHSCPKGPGFFRLWT